jgi:hypothetical protein
LLLSRIIFEQQFIRTTDINKPFKHACKANQIELAKFDQCPQHEMTKLKVYCKHQNKA